MNLRHALILAINTSILIVLFAFTAWLYVNSRSEVETQVAASLDRAALMTDDLAALREERLSSLAQSIAASPLLKGALATADRETVEDVLDTVAAKNGLTEAAVVRGKTVAYRSKGSPRGAELTAGRFSGAASLEPGVSLVLAEEPTSAHLAAWSKITSVSYVLDAAGAEVRNIAAADVLDAYQRPAKLLGGRFRVTLYAPRAPYWKSFEARRNSLVVLGSVLFFFGLLLSLVFSAFIEKYTADSSGAGESAQWRRLLAEIEEARARLPRS